MARQKEKPKAGGAPEWMVTYGDMMTLLLCFFVILVAMSEVKEEEKVQEVLRSVAEALGGHPTADSTTPGENVPMNSLMEQIQSLGGQSTRTRRADSSTRAQHGQWRRVRKIRDGLKVVMGGQEIFLEGSAELTEALKRDLDEFVEVVRGKPNKLIVQGHAMRKPLPAGSAFADHWDLAYARAKTVMRYLVDVGGIDRRRVRISSAGSQEPVRETREDSQRAANRRVDIFVTESFVRDYVGGTVGTSDLPVELPNEVDQPAAATGPADEAVTEGR